MTLSARGWRRVNFVLAVAWLLLIPPAGVAGWLQSVVFVSAVSLYANVASHIAGWRADVPTDAERQILAVVTDIRDRLERLELAA